MSPGRSSSQSEVVDALLLAARNSTIERDFAIAEMPRLADSAAEDARATLAARFMMVDSRVAIDGEVTATLQLKCQRCLQNTSVAVEDEFSVVLVPSETEMEQLNEQQDAIVTDAARLDLCALVEEQLLLAMPLVPMHDDVADCDNAARVEELSSQEVGEKQGRSESDSDTVDQETPQRPFANLRDMLNAKSASKKAR